MLLHMAVIQVMSILNVLFFVNKHCPEVRHYDDEYKTRKTLSSLHSETRS